MMMKVDFSSIRKVKRKPAGLLVTLLVNWVIKPFSMALLAWAFFRFIFAGFISPSEADQYIAGCIILAAAPCTAMVFVWSQLTKGDPAYTLVQVSVNDLIMLVLFVPVVQFLVAGASSLTVPFEILLDSVLVFVVVPLTTGTLLRLVLLGRQGKERLRRSVAEVCSGDDGRAAAYARADLRLPGGEHHQQVFSCRTDRRADHIAGLFERRPCVLADEAFQGRTFRCAPGALIGASNFFELAVATAIALFGPESGAALATVVGVLWKCG